MCTLNCFERMVSRISDRAPCWWWGQQSVRPLVWLSISDHRAAHISKYAVTSLTHTKWEPTATALAYLRSVHVRKPSWSTVAFTIYTRLLCYSLQSEHQISLRFSWAFPDWRSAFTLILCCFLVISQLLVSKIYFAATPWDWVFGYKYFGFARSLDLWTCEMTF